MPPQLLVRLGVRLGFGRGRWLLRRSLGRLASVAPFLRSLGGPDRAGCEMPLEVVVRQLDRVALRVANRAVVGDDAQPVGEYPGLGHYAIPGMFTTASGCTSAIAGQRPAKIPEWTFGAPIFSTFTYTGRNPGPGS